MSRKRKEGQADPLAARRAALRVLLGCHPADLPFRTAFQREQERRPLAARDVALAHTIAAGTLKLRRRLDFISQQFLEPKRRALPNPICQILRLGNNRLILNIGGSKGDCLFIEYC